MAFSITFPDFLRTSYLKSFFKKNLAKTALKARIPAFARFAHIKFFLVKSFLMKGTPLIRFP